MRQVTATEKYRAVNEGKMAKKEFVRQMRQSYPMYVSQYDGFDSTVQILKNKGMLFEAAPKAFSGVKVYDDRPALTYSLDALERGIRIELESLGHDFPNTKVSPEDYLKAEKKAKDNLEKDANHYLNLMAGESNKVDKHDKEKEVKRGAADKDTFNDMKKATLKEEVDFSNKDGALAFYDNEDIVGTYGVDDAIEFAKELAMTHFDAGPQQDKFVKDFLQAYKESGYDKGEELEEVQELSLEERLREALSDPSKLAATKAIKAKYPDVTAGILDAFFDMHGGDIEAGADPEDEFTQFFLHNFDVDEKKGTDHDGDGDIDSDDYLAAKDKAIKKAMGKDESYAMKRMQQAHTQDRLAGKKSTYDQAKEKNKEQEKQLKEAIKGIIKKSLLNEAATAKLADWGEGYEGFEGVKPVVNELENIVTEIEVFYDKISEKIAKTFEKTAGFKNEEGLKIGAFIAPSLESAFKQDLRPVTKKGFFGKVQLPQVRRITQADVDAHNSGARPLGETEIEEKSTVYTPNF